MIRAKLALAALASLVCFFSAPFLGADVINPRDALDAASPENLIFWRLRFPRCVAAYLAGAGLSLCGLAFQALFRNPLATPFTLGVSSGAALGASLYAVFGSVLTGAGMAGSVGSALLGCFLSMLLVYGVTRASGGFSTAVMLLAGVIINFFFSSLVMFVQYASDAHDAVLIMRWLMGGFSGVDPARLWELAMVVLPGCWLFSRIQFELDLLTAGEEIAASRGVEVNRVKLLVFVAASIITGVIVSITGPIGFVGMMIPQICRLWLGFSHSALIPASFFMGGGFLVLCDLLARSALAPAELPIGILTSLLGAPFFLWMLFRGNGLRELD